MPDFNGRFPLGSGNSSSTGSYSHPLNEVGGAERTALLIDQIPAHSHGVTIGYRIGEENGTGNDYSDLTGSGDSSSYTTTETGGNGGKW